MATFRDVDGKRRTVSATNPLPTAGGGGGSGGQVTIAGAGGGPVVTTGAPSDGPPSLSAVGMTVRNLNHVFTGDSFVLQFGNTLGTFVISKGGVGLATGQVTVGTTAVRIVAARTGRQKVTLTPTTNAVFYVGGAGVTQTTGMFVPAGASVTLDTAAEVFAIAPASVIVSFIELF